MGPYLFAAYIGSVLAKNTDKNIVLYADDSTVIETVSENSVSSVKDIISCLTDIGLFVNPQKCNILCVKRSHSHFCSDNLIFEVKQRVIILGVIFNNKFSWKDQISSVIARASKRFHVIRVLKKIVSVSDLKMIYHALITALLLHGSPAYGHLNKGLILKLERLQKRAHRLICGVGCSCADFPPIERRFCEAG